MTLRRTQARALAGAFAVLAAGCASAGGSTETARISIQAECAASVPRDSARLAAAFDSLHALALRGRAAEDLVLAPHDQEPKLVNDAELERLLSTLYPRELLAAGLGGATDVAILVDASGAVRNVALVRASTHNALNLATVSVAKEMRFRPARQQGCPVPFFKVTPFTWVVDRTPEAPRTPM
jgi:TonB family protein